MKWNLYKSQNYNYFPLTCLTQTLTVVYLKQKLNTKYIDNIYVNAECKPSVTREALTKQRYSALKPGIKALDSLD